jgi:hypothetical protein
LSFILPTRAPKLFAPFDPEHVLDSKSEYRVKRPSRTNPEQIAHGRFGLPQNMLLHVIPAKAGIQCFHGLQILWTPVFTGETNTVQFFHVFPFSKGGLGGFGFESWIFVIGDCLELIPSGMRCPDLVLRI